MSFSPLSLGAAPDVLITTTKKLVTIRLGPAAVRRLGWSEDEPNVTAALGEGDDAGWLRIALDEDGVTPESVDGQLVLTLPRSMLPDLQDCRSAPIASRGALDVRLPTIAAGAARRTAPRLAAVGGKPTIDDTLDVIAVPDLYQAMHESAWANGVELMFLSDGSVSVNGKMMPADDVENVVRGAIERRSIARQRAS